MKKTNTTVRKILVIGSSNTDMVINSPRLPMPGETILGGSFFMNPGGKGANQAVAAARLGADVTFICKVGNDIFGQQSRQLFEKEKIDTKHLLSDPLLPSGIALITVDAHAENCIVVASGANANLLPADFADTIDIIEQADMLLIQLEIPMETVEYVAAIAAQKGIPVILNPAPAHALSKSLLQNLFLITPNETEAELISGVKITDDDSATAAAKTLCEMGVKNVIITQGSKGAFIYSEHQAVHIPSLKIQAVDTTAAGDVFNGALAVALSEGLSLSEATRFACKAAAISATRPGAQSSAPYRHEADAVN